jgi:hypothetical protein
MVPNRSESFGINVSECAGLGFLPFASSIDEPTATRLARWSPDPFHWSSKHAPLFGPPHGAVEPQFGSGSLHDNYGKLKASPADRFGDCDYRTVKFGEPFA